jgi:hypothetical protein
MRSTGPAMVGQSKKRIPKKAVYALLVIALVLIAIFVYHMHSQNNQASNAIDANDLQIQTYKKSKNVDDMRVVLSAYEGKGDYESALPLAQKIAGQTKTTDDYMAVLNICAQQNISGKDSCLKDVVGQLKPKITSMTFNSSYAAGALLEKNGYKKDAADFYQRAYDVYAPDPKAENMMSQVQLKAHIDELRK